MCYPGLNECVDSLSLRLWPMPGSVQAPGGAGLDLAGPGWRITRCSPGAQQEQQQSSTKHWFAPVEPLDVPGGGGRGG